MAPRFLEAGYLRSLVGVLRTRAALSCVTVIEKPVGGRQDWPVPKRQIPSFEF